MVGTKQSPEELGFSEDEVSWVTVPFNSSYAPGKKKFDLDINQVSITPARERVVDFSEGYPEVTRVGAGDPERFA